MCERVLHLIFSEERCYMYMHREKNLVIQYIMFKFKPTLNKRPTGHIAYLSNNTHDKFSFMES